MNCFLNPAFVLVFCAAALPVQLHAQAALSPDEDQSKVIARTQNYAETYIGKLPDFVCVQTTIHYLAGKRGDRWRKKDVTTAQLVFKDGKENRTLKEVNGKPLQRAKWDGGRDKLTTEGEFGILLANVLWPNSSAEIVWQGFEKLRGMDVAVIKYSIDQEHSTVKISRSYLASAIVPYSGEVFADPATGAVLRITKRISDFPPELETESSLAIIDYTKVSIGGVDYLLPSTASEEMVLKSGRLRNEMSFGSYQKFDTNSTITFQP